MKDLKKDYDMLEWLELFDVVRVRVVIHGISKDVRYARELEESLEDWEQNCMIDRVLV